MTTIDIIKKSLEMKDKYNSNIFELIEDLNIRLYKINDIEDVDAFTTTINNIPCIFINSNLENYEKSYTLSHEVGHILFHDDTLRQFSKIVCKNTEEIQADIFATIFGDFTYKDDCGHWLQKKVNYIISNYSNIIIDYADIR